MRHRYALRQLSRASLVLAMCALGCATHRARPTCSETARDCGTGWMCVERVSLEACVAVVIPYPCLDTTYLCLAQGILGVGEPCLAESECMEGLYCPAITEGRETPTCSVPQCDGRDDCPAGQACRSHECRESLGALCGTELPCARHEYCAVTCEPAPAQGGNPCLADDDCAEGRACAQDHTGARYCTVCDSDAECAADEAGAYCRESFCAACNAALCGAERVCEPWRGCVECVEDADCEPSFTCSQYVCREQCDFPNHDECASGQCAVGDLCVAEVGRPCSREDRHVAECGDGSCLARDSSGASIDDPYCTRACGSSSPACPSGYTCVENVSVGGVTEDLCLAVAG